MSNAGRKITERESAIKALEGRKIVEVVVDEELDNEVTLMLDDMTAVGVMCDPEGNHPGSLHITTPKGKYYTLGWR